MDHLSFIVTRFAPSPTGPLHLGHAYSALLAHDMATGAGGHFLLRIEDIDQSRAARVGGADLRRSRLARARLAPARACASLSACAPIPQRCGASSHRVCLSLYLLAPRHRRRRLRPARRRAADRPGRARLSRHLPPSWHRPRDAARWRCPAPRHARRTTRGLGAAPASPKPAPAREARPAGSIGWDNGQTVGDVVLARPAMGTSYHLSVVLDDAAQGITHRHPRSRPLRGHAIHVSCSAFWTCRRRSTTTTASSATITASAWPSATTRAPSPSTAPRALTRRIIRALTRACPRSWDSPSDLRPASA